MIKPLPTPRVGPAAVGLNGVIYVIGGRIAAGTVDVVEADHRLLSY